MQNLVNAYVETCYRVLLPCGWVSVRIGQQTFESAVPVGCNQNPVQDNGLNQSEWLIITACNPRSKRLRNVHNFMRHRLLTQQLQTLGLEHYPSLAIADEGYAVWPNEYGWLVMSDDWSPVFRLASDFKQNAVVTHRSCDVVHLCMMRAQNTKISLSEHPYIDFASQPAPGTLPTS